MMEEKKRKKPSIPFSTEETNELLRLVKENIEEVEDNNVQPTGAKKNKMSPHEYWRMKDNLWDRISRQYAAAGCPRREGSALRTKWNNLKAKSRKDYGTSMKAYYQTGGGPYTESPLTDLSSRVRDILEKVDGVDGLRGQLNRPDDDQVITERDPPSTRREPPSTITSGALDMEERHQVIPEQRHHLPSTRRDTPSTITSGALDMEERYQETAEMHVTNDPHSYTEYSQPFTMEFQPEATSTQAVADAGLDLVRTSSIEPQGRPVQVVAVDGLNLDETFSVGGYLDENTPRPRPVTTVPPPRPRTDPRHTVPAIPRGSGTAANVQVPGTSTSSNDVRQAQAAYYLLLTENAKADEERKRNVEKRAEEKYKKEMENLEEEMKMKRELFQLKKDFYRNK